jgi:acid phosphatase
MRIFALGLLAAVLLSACSSGQPRRTPHSGPTGTPHTGQSRVPSSTAPATTGSSSSPAHLVVVVEENHSYGDVIGNAQAPYLNQLANTGRSLTRMYGIGHPSEPNYLALFSGSTHGITDDSCPHTFPGPDLGSQLLAHHLTFVGYSEGLPAAGSTVCVSGSYARKHAPWVNFADLPATQINRPFTDFPRSYSRLPAVSFVIPNLDDDMHDGTIAAADSWLKAHLGPYATWAAGHNSQLIVTWDEDDGSASNRIPTIITGAGVVSGTDGSKATLYSLLRLIEQDYGLKLLGGAAHAPVMSLR